MQVKQFSQLRLRMGKHVALVRSKGEKPAKVLLSGSIQILLQRKI